MTNAVANAVREADLCELVMGISISITVKPDAHT
jgi:hypothetical protein